MIMDVMSRLLILGFMCCGIGLGEVIHVSPEGNDANDGTSSRPLATPKGAQKLAREIIRKGLKEPLEIRFGAGFYGLEQALLLGPQDSGTQEFPVTWRALTDQQVIWSGGVSIGGWKKGEGGVWSTSLKGVGLNEGQWNFRQLFVGEKRMTRARFPNVSEANPFLYATGGGMDHAMIDPKLVKASWGEAPDAQINLVPHWKFFNQWNTVTKVDAKAGRIDFADSERHGKVFKNNWFWIEGVREELDEPGEWHLDVNTGQLDFMPPEGIELSREMVMAPRLNRLVHLKGDVNAGTHVKHVHFKGIEFRHTTFTLGHIEARVHTDAAVMFENAKHCSVRDCHFENIGGYALWLHLDCQHNVFDSNVVRQSGGGGVLMTGARLSYMDESKIYTPGEAAAKVAPFLNEVTRNTVEDCGKIRYYGGGVHMDSRPFAMAMAPGNTIAYNHFNNLSRNGVFAFRNQGGSVVEYNHIHNAMQTTIDGAAIHFATMNHLNAPNEIRNNWLYDIWGYNQRPDGKPNRVLANGVFLDWDTSNTTVKDNWVYNTGGKAIKAVFQNENNTFENNPSTQERQVPPFAEDVGPKGSKTNGIKPEDLALTGSVIHWTDKDRVTRWGDWQEETVRGLGGLFEFRHLLGEGKVSSGIRYSLPIPEDGTYQISLLYKPGKDRASNAQVEILHATRSEKVIWNMRKGSRHGFSVEVGRYAFKKGQAATVTISTQGADGKVIADSVAFVKVGK